MSKKNLKELWRQIGNGSSAGAIATLPMTLSMLAMQRMLPKWQRYDLPPENITGEISKRAGIEAHQHKPTRVTMSVIAHFGYGAMAGGIYALLTRKFVFSASVQGILFGLLVWLVSYLGLLPSLQMKTTAIEEPPQRNLLMIIAHIVWGAVMGEIVYCLERANKRVL